MKRCRGLFAIVIAAALCLAGGIAGADMSLDAVCGEVFERGRFAGEVTGLYDDFKQLATKGPPGVCSKQSLDAKACYKLCMSKYLKLKSISDKMESIGINDGDLSLMEGLGYLTCSNAVDDLGRRWQQAALDLMTSVEEEQAFLDLEMDALGSFKKCAEAQTKGGDTFGRIKTCLGEIKNVHSKTNDMYDREWDKFMKDLGKIAQETDNRIAKSERAADGQSLDDPLSGIKKSARAYEKQGKGGGRSSDDPLEDIRESASGYGRTSSGEGSLDGIKDAARAYQDEEKDKKLKEANSRRPEPDTGRTGSTSSGGGSSSTSAPEPRETDWSPFINAGVTALGAILNKGGGGAAGVAARAEACRACRSAKQRLLQSSTNGRIADNPQCRAIGCW